MSRSPNYSGVHSSRRANFMRSSGHLLGRHIAGRSHDRPGLSLVDFGVEELGQAEVRNLVDLDDVRMLQARGGFGLRSEPCQFVRADMCARPDHLDRHVALKLGVPRLVHDSHATATQFGQDLIASEVRTSPRGGLNSPSSSFSTEIAPACMVGPLAPRQIPIAARYPEPHAVFLGPC